MWEYGSKCVDTMWCDTSHDPLGCFIDVGFCLNDIYIDQGQRKPNEDDKVKRWIHGALFEAIATWLVLKGCICFYEHFPKDLPVYTKRNSETQTILNWQSS